MNGEPMNSAYKSTETSANNHGMTTNNQSLFARPSIPSSLNFQARPTSGTNGNNSYRVNDSRVSYNYLLKPKPNENSRKNSSSEQRNGCVARKSCLLSNGNDYGRSNECTNRISSRTSTENLTPSAKLQRRKSYDPKQSIDSRFKNQTNYQIIEKNMTTSVTSPRNTPNQLKDINNNKKLTSTTSFATKKPISKRSTSAHTTLSDDPEDNYDTNQSKSPVISSRNQSSIRSQNTTETEKQNIDSSVYRYNYPDHLVDELMRKLYTIKKFVVLLKDIIKDEYGQQNSSCDSGDDVFAEEELNQIYNELEQNKPLSKAFKNLRSLEGTVLEMYAMLSPDNDEVLSTFASLMRSSINYKEPKNYENLKHKVFEKLLTKPDIRTNAQRPPKFPQSF